MNLQKTNKTIRQNQELPIEEEKYTWILGSLKITMTKMENLDNSIAISMNI